MSAGIPLGPYLLLRRLARGGMAEIFLARKEGPEGFAREVAVKRILPHLAEDPAFTEMFLQEARIAARLTHPNVVQVFDFGEVDGSWFLAMEFVRGVDLHVLISRARRLALSQGRPGALPPHHAAKILSFVCEGLAHAHEVKVDGRSVGLVHRDVTPSNVLISFDGAVKVADFGVAKLHRGSKRDETIVGTIKGKQQYLSPEQARGERLDARSDLFNVGVLLFEALSGQTLFPHENPRLSKSLSAAGRIPEPERIEQLPPLLAQVVRRALAPKPEDRYPDALALRAELEAFVRSAPEASDTVEIGRYVRTLFGDALEEQQPRAAGTMPTQQPGTAPLDDEGADSMAHPAPGPSAPASTAVARPPSPGGRVPATELLAPPNDGSTAPDLLADDDGAPSTDRLLATAAPDAEAAVPTRVDVRRRWRRRMPFLLAAAVLVVGAASAATLALWKPSQPSSGSRAPPSPGAAPERPAPTAADARPTPTPPEPAQLRVRSEPPGLELRVDGESHGATPTLVELSAEPSRRTVELLRDGEPVARETVELEPGAVREVRLKAPPARGEIRVVTSPADALVRVDGDAVGEAPLQVELEPGEYDVEVELEGHEIERQTASIERPGQTATLAFALRPIEQKETQHTRKRRRRPRGTGTLAVATTPWSEVYLGDRHLGTTPLTGVELPTGRHVLTLRRPDSPPKRKAVVIRRNQETRVRMVH